MASSTGNGISPPNRAGPSTAPGPHPTPKTTRGKLSRRKTNSLEDQVAKIHSSLSTVISLLQHQVSPAIPNVSHKSTPENLRPSGNAYVSPLPAANTSASPHHFSSHVSPVGSHISPGGASSLEQWVQQIAAIPPPASASTSDLLQNVLSHTSTYVPDEVADDADEDEEHEGGLAMIRHMLREEESERLRADGLHHPAANREATITPDPRHDQPRNGKRKRWETELSSDSVLQRGTMGAGIYDAVAAGLCTETQGRELFNLFFRGAHTFMPVYNPMEDDWNHLRGRSPFSISAILYVGQRIRDAGKSVSDLQRRLREQAESIAKTTLFSPVATVEALQAMIVLASWGDTSWRPGMHALSMAYDMELYRCLPRLAEIAKQRRGGLIPENQVSAEKSLVLGARLWLLVSKMAVEMAFNHGRPLPIPETELVIMDTRAFLSHPLGLSTDSRLVASCELLLLRLPLHRTLLSDDVDRLDECLRVYNDDSRAWEDRWQDYYLQRAVSSDDVLVTDLVTQRCFGTVLTNSCLLRSLRSRGDVDTLPRQRRECLLSSLFAARLVSSRILAKEKDKLLYANHYSHVALASVLRIYIRLSSLFPEAVDLKRTAKDLTQLADVLANFPGVQLAQRLRYAIQKARRQRIFPAETRPSSPGPGWRTTPTGQDSFMNENSTGASFTSLPGDLAQNTMDFDLFLAEQILHQPFTSGQGTSNEDWMFPIVQPDPLNPHSMTGETAYHQPGSFPWLDFPALDFNSQG